MTTNNAANFQNPLTPINGGTGQISNVQHGIMIGQGTNPVTTIVLGGGQVLLGTGVSSDPTATTLLMATSWTDVTGTSQTMAANSGYFADNAALVTLALPATAAKNSIIEVLSINTGLWKISQASGQQIFFGNQSTTLGATGNLTATNIYDYVRLICITANTTWAVIGSIGNITVT